MLADPLLRSKNTRQSTKALIEIGSRFQTGTSAGLVQQWHEAMKEIMFLRGLGMNRQIVQSLKITALTTKTIPLAGKQP